MKMRSRTQHFEEYIQRLTDFCKSDAWADQLAQTHMASDPVWDMYAMAVENQDLLMEKELEAAADTGTMSPQNIHEVRAALAVSVACLVELDRVLEAKEKEANERFVDAVD